MKGHPSSGFALKVMNRIDLWVRTQTFESTGQLFGGSLMRRRGDSPECGTGWNSSRRFGPLLLLPSLLRAFSKHRPSKLRLNLSLYRGLQSLNHKVFKTQTAKCRIRFGLPDKVFGKVSEIDCLSFHDAANVSYDTDVVYS
jgi:hypothetical protein